MAVDEALVRQTLNKVRPALQADGGDVELVEITDEGNVIVELQGHCKGCPMSQLTLANAIERTLQEEVPGVNRVLPSDMDSANVDAMRGMIGY